MKALLFGLIGLLHATLSFAISPYLAADRQAVAPVAEQLNRLEQKLRAEGFNVVGRHLPPGLPQHGSLVVTDAAMLGVIRTAGGTAILGAGIRVGARSDGTVSYMNPDYWYRAYLRGGFDKAQAEVAALGQRLTKALGPGGSFGGDVPAENLADYRYLFGMERIDASRNELRDVGSFDEALRTVQANLARGAGKSAKVYEVILADRQLAVFGVAMPDPAEGESWWAGKIGPDHIAALPYEIFIVGGKIHALYGRYRIALAWPALGMGQFMGIMRAPDLIHATMERLAGVAPPAN